MQKLTPSDLQFVVRRLPKDVRTLMQNNFLLVGGGFVRETIAGGEVKDIDAFSNNKELLSAVAQTLAAIRGVKLHSTDNAITLLCPPRLPVQFITRWCFADPEVLVKSFDFTVCQAAVWFDSSTKTWDSMCHEAFYPDLAARRLVYTFPEREEEAGGSMMRVRKFLMRGYTIQAHSLGGVIARLARKVKWEKCATDQDAAFALSALLHEVDPLVVIDGLEPIDEHQAV